MPSPGSGQRQAPSSHDAHPVPRSTRLQTRQLLASRCQDDGSGIIVSVRSSNANCLLPPLKTTEWAVPENVTEWESKVPGPVIGEVTGKRDVGQQRPCAIKPAIELELPGGVDGRVVERQAGRESRINIHRERDPFPLHGGIAIELRDAGLRERPDQAGRVRKDPGIHREVNPVVGTAADPSVRHAAVVEGQERIVVHELRLVEGDRDGPRPLPTGRGSTNRGDDDGPAIRRFMTALLSSDRGPPPDAVNEATRSGVAVACRERTHGPSGQLAGPRPPSSHGRVHVGRSQTSLDNISQMTVKNPSWPVVF